MVSLKFQKPAAWEQEFQLCCQVVAFMQYAYMQAAGTYSTETSSSWTCVFSKSLLPGRLTQFRCRSLQVLTWALIIHALFGLELHRWNLTKFVIAVPSTVTISAYFYGSLSLENHVNHKISDEKVESWGWGEKQNERKGKELTESWILAR